MRSRRPALACLLLLLIGITGCGSSRKNSLSGKLLVNGLPAVRAMVFFTPRDGSPKRALALVEADGSFRLSGKDGVPPGEYAVTVVWPEYAMNGGEEISVGDRLNRQYSDPANPVATVQIKAGANGIPPLDLRTP